MERGDRRSARGRGHDVVAAQEPEHARYAGIPDDEVFELAVREGRTIVTDNIADYEHARLEWETSGRRHHGVIYALNPPFNRHRGKAVIGQTVQALDAFLRSDTALSSAERPVHHLRIA